jgi:hypothetical protein
MIFGVSPTGVSPTKDAVVVAQATGAGETFVIKSISSTQFQARSGDGLNEFLQRRRHIRSQRYEPRLDDRTARIVVGSVQVFHRSNN